MQWIHYDEEFMFVVDLDRRPGNGWQGTILVGFNEPPNWIAEIFIPEDGHFLREAQEFTPVWAGGQVATTESLAARFPSGYDATARIELVKGASDLTVRWRHAPVGAQPSEGSVILPDPDFDAPSMLLSDPEVKTWDDFKQICRGGARGSTVWRGQSKPWKLRTKFHRSQRSDLLRYEREELSAAWRTLTGVTSHIFDMQTLEGKVSFMHLLQHHGFPTPLLDWSDSPYVAAFFAFRADDLKPDGHVRIFAFDRAGWSGLPHFANLSKLGPHLSMLQPLAIENPRAMPQQALCGLTNIDDVEAYLAEFATRHSRHFLRAYDLPCSERKNVFADLTQMGLSAGSLFPGLDGMCEALTMQFFGPNAI